MQIYKSQRQKSDAHIIHLNYHKISFKKLLQILDVLEVLVGISFFAFTMNTVNNLHECQVKNQNFIFLFCWYDCEEIKADLSLV